MSWAPKLVCDDTLTLISGMFESSGTDDNEQHLRVCLFFFPWEETEEAGLLPDFTETSLCGWKWGK